MSRNNEEELEFISVAGEDDNELNNYMDPASQEANGGGVMGSWIFTQSKVSFTYPQRAVLPFTFRMYL